MQSGLVTTEGDDLYYEIRGQGPPLLMIAGGLGDGGIYSFVADRLCDEFKVITYDRRGQSRSTRRDPQNFEIGQQSRDAVAVLRAAGEASATVFGSSSGAVIGLEMARSQAGAVRALIAHEPPVIRILPDAAKWQTFFARLYLTCWEQSPQKALQDFLASIAIPPTMPDAELLSSPVFREIDERQKSSGSSEFGMKHELIASSNYQPDVEAIRRNGTRVVVAVGQLTQDAGAYYGRTVPILAEQLGCEMVIFPGHHGSHMVSPRAWGATLRGVLNSLVMS